MRFCFALTLGFAAAPIYMVTEHLAALVPWNHFPRHTSTEFEDLSSRSSERAFVEMPQRPVWRFVTLWEQQVKSWGLDDNARYINWLEKLAIADIDVLMLSSKWTTVEPSRDSFNFSSIDRLAQIAKDAKFRIVVVLEAQAPQWALTEFKQARLEGGGPENHVCNHAFRHYLSDLHPAASERMRNFLTVTVSHLTKCFGNETFMGFNPTWNNELEAKSNQECDFFWDYSRPAQDAYAEWLLKQNTDRTYWQRRWLGKVGEEQSLQPPRIWGAWFPNRAVASGPDQLAFWDWMRFRIESLSHTHENACKWILSVGGGRCFLHFGEFFSSVDAIYANPFFELANSSYVTDLILDTNFLSFLGTRLPPVSGGLLVSTAQLYAMSSRKRIWFESAFETLDVATSTSYVKEGMLNALGAGAHGLGLTNVKPEDVDHIIKLLPWKQNVTRWSPTALIFFPYESFFSFRKWRDGSKDVLQDLAHNAYIDLKVECQCQVLVVGDIMHLPIEILKGFDVLVWQQVPGVLPSYVRNRMAVMQRAHPRWRIQSVPGWICQLGFPQVVAPVMGRPTVQAMPDFIIAGPPKAASSTLFDWLSRYNQTKPSNRKEINYFDRNLHHYGLNWYANFFQPFIDKNALVFEATPNYMYHPDVPQRMAQVLPTARLIFVLRNPIDRAWSDYKMWVRQGITQRSFDDMVAECIAKMDAVSGAVENGLVYEASLRESCKPRPNETRTDSSGNLCACFENIVAKGLYHEQVKRWRRFYVREQMLFLRMETFAEPRAVLKKVESFLGLASLPPGAYEQLVPVNTASKPINDHKFSSDDFKMSANASRMLEQLYRRAPELDRD